MTYSYTLSRSAERYLDRIERRRLAQIVDRLHALCRSPRDRTLTKPLHGQLDGIWSSSLSGLRILYTIDDEVKILAVLDVGPRGDIYKRP